MGKKIQLRIYPDGTVQANVEGIKGKKCTDYIKIIEDILDAEVIDSEYTPEYYESEKIEVNEEDTIKLNGGI
ncbi:MULTISPECIES: DUF2997 domain-containing protein [Clostridium]|uniref:Acylphosphatase n=2 Tax=Clostridium beijerinckii TaxID=1520 RepID=A0A1S8PJI5_CLOBE|nr:MULTISPECIES: DUF2997 domain-containing protein [Clostridium]ABR35926.1 conserved hypothetical protein [Clostridium beijerinckii NCIMB 8052]AIU01403.1 hypothetical protein Cbs_3809 [Clostridium beijerinckii ATCC 35702]MBF7809437.1 DUF2997 domain-containing protein [Clostridium beijerinckii]NRT23032.1 acylphosphatase [Clostridium beijerinckii]NRT69808.1 acylphosphatase [Clostridium beijerinckii]